MSQNMVICHVSEELKEALVAFKFNKSKTNNALIIKVDRSTDALVIDEKIENLDVDDLGEMLPSHEPRFVALSYIYKQSDGRVSYPYCMIFSTPIGCPPDLKMMYAGSFHNLVEVAKVTKTFEVRSPDEISVEWIEEKLHYFR